MNSEQQSQKNHQSQGSLVDQLRLKEIIARDFPAVQFAFGYGSGVIRQKGYDYGFLDQSQQPSQTPLQSKQPSQPMIDLFFGVEDADEWHKLNIKANPSHYSGLGSILGASYLHMLQQNITPVHFNPAIQLKKFSDTNNNSQSTLNVKYGVVDVKQLMRDLQKWNILTISGRLHKPVKIIHVSDLYKSKIQTALQFNLIQATAISLLLNFSPIVSINTFLHTIASLSYIGDVRFLFGAENKSKINNLVEGNFDQFSNLYKDIIQTQPLLNNIAQIYGNNGDHIKLDCSEETVFQLVNMIPEGLGLFARANEINVKTIDLAEIQRQIILRIRKINLGSSQKLILYNALATSPTKNVAYVFKKLQKGILKR